MLATAAAFMGRQLLKGVAANAVGSLFGRSNNDSEDETGGKLLQKRTPACGASLQQSAKREAACTVAMHKGWGPDWRKQREARVVHSGLCTAADKHANVLIGKGLTKWKAEATKLVKKEKRLRAKPRAKPRGGQMLSGVETSRAIGSPKGRFGVAPCIPEAPTSTKDRRLTVASNKKSFQDYISKTTHGTGANSRNSIGMPYNIDASRRPNVTTVRGGRVMSSGVDAADTLPARAMKSGSELDAEFPVSPMCAVIHNFGGNDATVEDITNYAARKDPSSGMKLFKAR